MSDELSVFQRYLAENAWTWRRLTPEPKADAPVILVDLMVDHPQYYLLNLIVAKYLQRLSGARLIGFADNRKHEKVFLAAKSFGVETVHAVNDTIGRKGGNTLIGVAEEFRCAGATYDFPTCDLVNSQRLVSGAGKNLHFQGRRPQSDFIYLP